MNPEHYINDLSETISRVRETFAKCRDSVPPADADPVEIARWEGAFMALRAILGEELQPLLESWEQGEPRWRSTEVMLARAQGFGDEYAPSGTKTEEGARAEGVQDRAAFAALWDGLAGPGTSWADDPWVWVVRFEREAL